MPAHARHREILRSFYALLAILAAAGITIAGFILARNAAQRSVQAHLELHHVPALMLAEEASRDVADLQRLLEARGTAAAHRTAGRKTVAAMGAIDQVLTSLEALGPAESVPGHGSCITRARRHLERIQELLVVEAPVGDRIPGRAGVLELAEALGISLFQLSRLHSGAVEEHLAGMEVRRHRDSLLLGAGSALVVLLTLLLVVRTLRLLRARLAEHQRTEEALFQRERELQQASKMEALGTLVGGVAHDFNNLLTAILGHADRLQSRLGSASDHAPSVRQIQAAGERAASLTRRLLAFSRREIIEPRVVRLDLLLRDMQDLLRRLIPEDIRLELHLAPDLHSVRTDPVQMEQVMMNLVVNARDAMPRGGRLVVEACNVDRDGPHVRIRVEDSGHGMVPEVQARIFEPFFTTKEAGQGTGLGLSTVHGIITRLDGTIQVTSRPGHGARFDIHLPRSEAAPGAPETAVGSAGPARGHETILLVEDEAQVRGLAALGLREAGYTVLEAADGAAGLTIWEGARGTIDLVLTDVVMPGIRGPQLVARLLEERPDLRIVYMSGYTQDAILPGTAMGEAPLVRKPFKLAHLLQVVRAELDRPTPVGPGQATHLPS